MPDDAPDPVARIARLFRRPGGQGPLPTRITAPLRRMAPERWSERLPEVLPVLVRAGLPVEGLSPDETRRWALLVHVVAVLAGTEGAPAHADGRRAGAALHAAGLSEARLARLLSARGSSLLEQVARLARLLAARGAAPLDLRPFARLVIADGSCEPDAARRIEDARLDIARSYYAALDRAAGAPEPKDLP